MTKVETYRVPKSQIEVQVIDNGRMFIIDNLSGGDPEQEYDSWDELVEDHPDCDSLTETIFGSDEQ